jgi:hypothetical protein
MISKKRKKLLCEYVDYICENCKNKYNLDKLQIHRIKRGNIGGTYDFRNCKVLCNSCHKLIHSNEIGVNR